jgi:phosphoglycolate phosphatase
MLIVFDLDGTLIDSKRDLAESTNEMLSAYGAEPLPMDAVMGFVGEGAGMLVRRALRAAGRQPDLGEAIARFREIYDRRLLLHTRPYPGVPEMLQALAARARLAVLTNKPERPARQILEAFDLGSHFTRIIGGDGAFPRKPDPSALTHLMDESGDVASSTLVVGDSMIDVETARNAGVPICLVLYGFGSRRGLIELRQGELQAERPEDVTSLALTR